ncbi:DEAD/DEAH box helicase [Desulfofundulus sp. TPOSR]|uniref:helicase C-terminal domain-containing protein n=1 Tax=Desulfofundulus sp. TPOSR TaxID=2714340 RepID=UPI00140B1F7A|nr:helicase C-terminal domain-containing protein [Desulfofundulus sp. TPOSR]NHM25535.1 DEAD/DEAH box helicase [Desulfofundulus sp. TPOSR]
MPYSVVVCDVETTGLNPQHNEIIEIALLRLEEGEITGQFHSLVRPRQRVPATIHRLTGLSDELLATAPPLDEVLPSVMDFLGNNSLMGHNVSFDRDFLQAAAGTPIAAQLFDTRELARILLPNAPGFRLADLCRFLGIEQRRVHRALDDALATVSLYRRLLDKAAEMEGQVLLYLAAFLQRAGSAWADEIGQLAWQSRSRKITRPAFFLPPEPEETQEPVCPRNLPQSSRELAALLEPGGPLALHLESYEYRPQQARMVDAVTRALEEEKFLLMEAGTGTGKSMAYLIPAFYWSLSRGQRVLIATRTINLQEQLWQRDIPLVKAALGWSCRTALVKGRQNYLCLRRWLNTLQTRDWTAAEAAFYARILVWTQETTTGDRSELNLSSLEQELWQELCADSEACLGSRCRWFARACYVSRVRGQAERANLIIVNHSLLFSDVRAENRVLPEYAALVVDEAHHLEDAATEQLGRAISRTVLFRWLNKLNRLLIRLSELAPPRGDSSWLSSLQKVRDTSHRAFQGAESFFNALQQLVIQQASIQQKENTRRHVLRLQPGLEGDITAELQSEQANLLFCLKDLLTGLKKLIDHLESSQIEDESWAGPTWELSFHTTEGTRMVADLESILQGTLEKNVYWVEVHEGGEKTSCSLRAAPIQVNKILYEHLYQSKKSIIFTSATLTVEESFDHFMERTGLDLIPPERVVTMQVDSPFRYESQSLLCIVRGLPTPGEGSEDIYFATVASTLLDLAEITGGRMLVLYTSHRALQETYRRLKPVCEERDICLLGHNLDGNHWQLVEEFRTSQRAILMGASSFWEGVDIPGPALSCVVMVKLPFWAPQVPVVEARLEELASQGKDGFRHFSLPQAIIRFKQGFGRLIRTAQDRGVVVVLDGRLLDKKYGRHFLHSLPLKSHIQGNRHLIMKRIAHWFAHPGSQPNWPAINQPQEVERFASSSQQKKFNL